ESVAGAYQNLGYLQVRVGTPELTVSGTKVRITIPVTQGLQTRIRSLSYEGNQAFESAELLLETYESTSLRPSQTTVEPGGPFSRNGVEDARIAMVRAYRDRGYLYGRIFSDVEYSKDGTSADVHYRFDEGPQVRVNRILVRGNRYTNDSVIRSRISFESGDIYRLEQALNDQRSINELGVFDTVRVRLIDESRPAEQKDLVAEVVESNRQPIEIAPGISTAEGPRVQASYSHINLFGTAGQLSVLAKVNRQVFFELYGDFANSIRQRFEAFSTADQIERVLQLGLRSPRYVNLFWEPTFRAELGTERDITLSYAFDSTRFSFGVDLQPTKRLRISLAPEVSLTTLTCASEDTDCLGTAQGTIGLFTLQNGERQAVKVGPAITYDARDNPFFPTSGYLAQASLDYSVGRSRDESVDDFTPQSFLRGEAVFSTYFGFGPTVLAISARAGQIRALQNEVPIFERFFLGGRTTLRGFPERTLIPEDCVIVAIDAEESENCQIRTETGDAPITQGGNNYALLKTELRVPLIGAASMGLFVDSGNLWFQTPNRNDLKIRVTTGAGLRYNTPVGPLALDVGVNPERRRENGEGRWSLHFTVGVF
ncbi:MAG: BamA/TamA family outer membrane protein, partial [Myxococcota bacterium]